MVIKGTIHKICSTMSDIFNKKSSSTHKNKKRLFQKRWQGWRGRIQEDSDWKSLRYNCMNGPRVKPGEKESEGNQILRDKTMPLGMVSSVNQVAIQTAVS